MLEGSSVEEVKSDLRSEYNISERVSKLFYKDKELNDPTQVFEFIYTVEMFIKFSFQVYVYYNNKTLTICVDPSESVNMIVKQIEKRLHESLGKMELYYQGEPLNREDIFSSYEQIKKGSTL